MPPTKVTLKSGWTGVVDAPQGASDADVLRLGKEHEARERPRPTPPQRDVVGRAHQWLTREPPAGTHTLMGETDLPGRVVRAAGDLFLPATIPEAAAMGATLPIGGNVITAPLKRIAAGSLAGGGAALAQGRDWASALTEGGRQGLSQFAGELFPGALRFGLTQKAGGRALAAREARVAHDRSMHEAVTGLEAEGYKGDVAARRAAESARIREARAQYQERGRDVEALHKQAATAQTRAHDAATAAAKESHAVAERQYAEEGATIIADSFKGQVGAWREFPSNEQGLLRMVYGDGQQKLSAVYDAVMKEIAQLGKGRAVEMLLKDAQALGLRFWDTRGPKERGMPDLTRVDASQLAEKATGYWKKNPGVYRRAVAALDALDIGDPAARAEYRAGQALIQFTNDTKMLKGERFNPDAARAGFTDLKKVDQLRRRGQGDIFTGPVAEAVRRPRPEVRLPPEPTPLTNRSLPAFRRPAPLPEVEPPRRRVLLEPPPPEGVRSSTLPKMGFWPGAAIAEIPFLVQTLATGQPHHGYGLPVAVGGLLSSGLSGRRVITQVPSTTLGQLATDIMGTASSQAIAQEARRATRPETLTLRPGEGPSRADIDRQLRERFGPTP
jgi:hypothetical protein